MIKDIKKFYEHLEVNVNATKDEIKKNYRTLAKKYHPDREDGDDESFKRIQEAYDTLSDENKRQLYDQNIDVDSMNNATNPFAAEVHMNVFDLGDILKNVFNVQEEREEEPKNQINKIVNLNLDDIVFGCTKKVQYESTKKCKKCDKNGFAHTGLMHCMGCNGQGYLPSFPFPSVCPSCNGESVIRQNLHKCKECTNGYLKELVNLEIKMDSGTVHNQKLSVNHELTVIFKHHINCNNAFTMKIKNNDIYIQVKITIEELILGFKKKIRLTEKESTVTLNSEQYFDTKESWVIENRGIQINENTRGDLFVKFVVEGSKYEKNLIKFRKAFEKIFA